MPNLVLQSADTIKNSQFTALSTMQVQIFLLKCCWDNDVMAKRRMKYLLCLILTSPE